MIVIRKYWKCYPAWTLWDSIQHTYRLLTSLHDFDARLIVKLHLQRHLDRWPCLRIQIVLVARHHQVPPPNRNRNRMLKMLRPTSSRPHTLQSSNGWRVLSGSILTLNSTFPHSMSAFGLSEYCSALEKMEIRLGKAQMVKPSMTVAFPCTSMQSVIDGFNHLCLAETYFHLLEQTLLFNRNSIIPSRRYDEDSRGKTVGLAWWGKSELIGKWDWLSRRECSLSDGDWGGRRYLGMNVFRWVEIDFWVRMFLPCTICDLSDQYMYNAMEWIWSFRKPVRLVDKMPKALFEHDLRFALSMTRSPKSSTLYLTQTMLFEHHPWSANMIHATKTSSHYPTNTMLSDPMLVFSNHDLRLLINIFHLPLAARRNHPPILCGDVYPRDAR